MYKVTINAEDGLLVRQESGVNAMRDNVPSLDISIAEKHMVGITADRGPYQSLLTVMPVRQSNGSFIPRDDANPEYHPDAYWMIRITGSDMRRDTFYQFDKTGKLLLS